MASRDEGIMLWERVRSGDIKSFDRLYERYSQMLMGYGVEMVGDRELVKDAIQDIFVNLWQQRQQVQIKIAMGAYLATCLRHRLNRNLAKAKKERIININVDAMGGLSPSVESQIIEKERSEEQQSRLKKMLQLLSPRQREAIILKYQGRLKTGEVAKVMGLKKKGVYKLIYTALKSLREKS